MGVGINMPKPKKDNTGSLLSLAGAGAGALVGGPAGAAVGMNLGGAVGGMMADQSQGPQAIDSGPMQRRMAQIDQSPLRQIRDSIDSLKYVDDDATRMELAKPLIMAEMKAKKGGAYGLG